MITSACNYFTMLAMLMFLITRYVLNTDIDRPHQGGVASVRFSMCASEDDSQTIMLVSVGSADRKFKLWRITDSQSDGSE